MEGSSALAQAARPEEETQQSSPQLKYSSVLPPSEQSGSPGQLLFDQISDDTEENSLQPLSAPERDHPSLSSEEEEEMFLALKEVFEEAEADTHNPDLSRLMECLELAEKEATDGWPNIEVLEAINSKIQLLWKAKSSYFARVTELLANGSRNPRWRLPYGKSGILDFYLRVITTKDVDDDTLLHALRLVGNSCADTDENRQRVVERNYTLSIMRLLRNPALVHVAIPVIYNICVDFEPAQAQVSANGIVYPLLRLLADDSIKGNALLTYAYELVEISSEQGKALDRAPDEAFRIIVNLAKTPDIAFPHLVSLLNSLTAWLKVDRFQQMSIVQGYIESLLAIYFRLSELDEKVQSPDDKQMLSTSRLAFTHAIAGLSSLPLYSRYCPLDSPVTETLISWLKTSDSNLHTCACVMIANLAQDDKTCESLIQNFQIHLLLKKIIDDGAKTTVLYAVLGLLKNLVIPGENKERLGDAGYFESLSKLWTTDMNSEVQWKAVSLPRQMVIGSIPNITRLLKPLSLDPDSPAYSRTYLSLMLTLFDKTDFLPSQIEVGRTVAAVCRVLLTHDSKSEVTDVAQSLTNRLFTFHPDVARPIATMILQADWPVIRTEGWFCLALMASSRQGSEAVGDCLQNMDVVEMLCELVRTGVSEHVEGESAQDIVDRQPQKRNMDNILILVKGILKHNPSTLTASRKQVLEGLMQEVAQPRSS